MKPFIMFFLLCTALIASEITHLHFLIPGGEKGGWDMTARSVGHSLISSGLIKSASYENMSGESGGKAIRYFIETANTHKNTLLINSTPIVIQSLQQSSLPSFRDFTLIASVIADYQVFAVKADSRFKTLDDVLEAFEKNPHNFIIGGGSARGGLDHVVAAQIFLQAGYNPRRIHYLPYDAGGNALVGLQNGDISLLSTGFGEVFEKYQRGEVRILAVTSDRPLDEAPSIPTFMSLGIDFHFANWRGFFGAPGLSEKEVRTMQHLLQNMMFTHEWEKIRKHNGWNNLYQPAEKMDLLLRSQENAISSVMQLLGIL